MKDKIKKWAFRLFTILIHLTICAAVWFVILMCYVGVSVVFSEATALSVIIFILACLIVKEIERIEEKINDRKK